MRHRTTKALAPLMTILLALGSLGCKPDTVQIGAVVPLTGQYQSYGEANKRGIELAYEEIRSDGYPLDLELTVADSGSDPAKARQLLEEQYANGAFVVIGGSVSDEAEEMVAGADRYDRVLLSPSATSPDLTKASRNFFRIAPSDQTEGSKMADFAFRVLELETVAVIAESGTYAQGIQQAFSSAYETLGGEILELIELPPNTSDLTGLIDRVVTLKPDAVYLAAYESGSAAMILELKRLGFAGRILTTHAFSSPGAIARVGPAAEGVVLTQTVFDPDSEHAHVKKFVDAYREHYGEEPNLFAAEGYDAMKVLSVALEERHTIASELPRGLWDAVKEFPGVTGSIQFDENGDVRKFPRVYVIGKNQALYDYSKRIEENEKKLREKQEELKRRLQEIRNSAARIGNGG